MLAEAPRVRSRHIEPNVPPLFVMLLHDAGKIPVVAFPPDPNRFGFRRPTLAEMELFSWCLEWEGTLTDERGFRKVAGIAAYRDTYDLHTASDVRDLCLIAGSRRSIVSLIRWLGIEAGHSRRRLIGSFDIENVALRRLCKKVTASVETRVTVEAA